MRARLSIVAGLIAGIAVAGLLIGGVIALVPERLPTSSPAPSLAVASAVPSTAPSASAGGSPVATASASAEASTGPFHIGELAPALSLPQVGGGTVDLAALRGKPVWINFMATWCPPCQDEFPLMNGFATRYGSNGLVVIAVDIKEDEAAVKAFGESLNATFPLALDADGEAADTWDAVALPVHFWIDAEGVVRHGALGGIGPDVMVEGLKTILPGVAVTP